MPEPTTPTPAPIAPPHAAVSTPAPVAEQSVIGAASVAEPVATSAPVGPNEAAKAPIELKVPDGFRADDKMLAEFKANAAELGLDSAKAQKLFDQYVGIETSRAKADEQAFLAQDTKWQAELAADPEFGGEHQPVTVMHVRRALKSFGGAEVARVLAAAGLGNHPALVRGFAKIGKALAEDSVSGSSPAAGTKPPAAQLHELLYPTMQTKTKE